MVVTHYRHSATVDVGKSVKLRMRIATTASIWSLAVLAACGPFGGGSDEPTGATSGSASASPSASPSASETPTGTPAEATDLVGDWTDPKAKWTVHFRDDGTYVEDFQGVKDFRVGEYEIDGDTVTLNGDDGNTDKGTVEGETLVFRLGTLERAAS